MLRAQIGEFIPRYSYFIDYSLIIIYELSTTIDEYINTDLVPI